MNKGVYGEGVGKKIRRIFSNARVDLRSTGDKVGCPRD